jgi:hypothetical protein
MMARDRRYRTGRRAAMATRAGIATAILAGAGVVAATTVATTSHGGTQTAAPAAYTARYTSEGTRLSLALSDWTGSARNSFAELTKLTQARGFSQAAHHGTTLDIQRGIVVLATRKFLILRSANGSLHLWLLSAATTFDNVSASKAGTAALTASSSATEQAMAAGNMIPATTLLAGSPLVAADLLTPASTPQTVTVQVAGTDLTVTVTVTRSTAAVSQTATTPASGMPSADPSTFTQDAWRAIHSVARGDLALVAGFRSHHTLHARLVLFTPLSIAVVGGRAGDAAASSPTVAPTSW